MYEYTKWTCPGCGHQNPKGEKHCSMCPFDARQPIDASPERPLRRHLDDRDNSPVDGTSVTDGWPVPGCVSPASD